MREFWVSSGHHLTRRAPGGGLLVTDELLLAYLARPELVPPDEACDAERALHAALMADPRRRVSPEEVARIADPDARENWELMLSYGARLPGAPAVEAAYLALVRRGVGPIPPLFLNQLVHLILRNALDGETDPYVLRAAELFFRPQRASAVDGALLLADLETIEAHELGRSRSPLVSMLGLEPEASLDVLDDGNAWTYWSRSDAHTMALNLGSNPKSRAGFGRAVEAFVRHLLHEAVSVEPLAEMRDPDWRWFVGLDAEATRIGNALWQGGELAADDAERVIGLFRLTFADAARVRPDLAGRPVYLILAMTGDRIVRMKPQNLVTGLPFAAGSQAA